jgi:hypothetical protein
MQDVIDLEGRISDLSKTDLMDLLGEKAQIGFP